MAQIIKIKRSPSTGQASPGSLSAGELAYSDNSKKLFIGRPNDGSVLTIGGEKYTDVLVFDNNDALKLYPGSGSSKTLTLQTDGTLFLQHGGTVDLTNQATEFKLIDNSATAGTFATADHTYLTFDTTNSSELIKFGRQVEFSGAYTLPTSLGSSGQALVSNGSTVTFQDVAATLTVGGVDDSSSEDVALLTDDLLFDGSTGVSASVAKSGTDVTVTITGTNATATSKGVAKFDSTDFTVTNGNVAANAITLGSSSLNLGETTTDIAGLTSLVVDDLTINDNTITSGQTNQNISLNPNGSGTVNVNNSRITNVSDPTGAQDAATKAYVDAVKQALDIKESVRVATTAAITISTALNVGDTIDGVTLADGDRVLVKNQTDASENGIYVAGSSPVRSADANASTEVTSGLFTFVEEGTVNGDNGFVLTTNNPITLDTTDLTFTQFNGAGQIIDGDGLSKSGNTLNVNDDNVTLEISSDNLRIKGITTTAVGDILLGAASNGGYTRHAKPGTTDVTANEYILSMSSAGVAVWGNVLDGGSF